MLFAIFPPWNMIVKKSLAVPPYNNFLSQLLFLFLQIHSFFCKRYAWLHGFKSIWNFHPNPQHQLILAIKVGSNPLKVFDSLGCPKCIRQIHKADWKVRSGQLKSKLSLTLICLCMQYIRQNLYFCKLTLAKSFNWISVFQDNDYFSFSTCVFIDSPYCAMFIEVNNLIFEQQTTPVCSQISPQIRRDSKGCASFKGR